MSTKSGRIENSGWDKLPFEKIVDNYDGKRVPIKSEKRVNTTGMYPYYGASGIIDYVDEYIFEGEYLLISEDGANLLARTYPIAFIADGRFWVNNHAHVVSAKKDKSINKFLEYFFANIDLKEFVTGAAQPKLSQKKLNSILVSLPPISEQKHIVSKLDGLFNKLDEAIKLVEENIEHTKHLLPAALNEVFSSPIYPEELLTVACEFNPQKAEVKNDKEIQVSFLPMTDLKARQMFFEPKQEKQLSEVYTGYTYFKDNDVLLAKVTPCFENGKSGIAKNLKNGIGFGSSEYYVFRGNKNILPEWIYYNISAIDFLKEGSNNMSGAVGLKRVTKDFINSWKIKLPNSKTQQKIIDHLNQLAEKQQALLNEYSAKLKHLKALKASLLSAAFKGGL